MNALVYPVVAVIAAIGLYFLYFTPLWDDIQVLKEEEAVFDQGLEQVRQIEQTIDALENSYATISNTDLLRLEKFLPRTFDQVRFMNDVTALVESRGILLEEISVTEGDVQSQQATPGSPLGGAEVADGPTRNKHVITVGFTTTYSRIKDVVRDIENSLQIANIDSVNIIAEENGLKATIDLVVYSFNLSDI